MNDLNNQQPQLRRHEASMKLRPAFVLAAPTKTGWTISFSGAVESQNSAAPWQTVTIDLKAQHTVFDDLLARVPATVPHPSGVWDGLLLPYTGSATLFTDPSGNIVGPLGSSGSTPAYVYQYLHEIFGVSNKKSDVISVP